MKQIGNNRRTFLGSGLVLAATLIGAGAGPVAAESLMERAGGEGLRVAFYNFKPYAYKNEAGELVGEQVDILRHVIGAMGGRIASEQATEWGNLIPGINARRFDVVAAGMFVTPKRCAAVRFSEPTFGIRQSLVVPKGNPKGITDYDSIRDKGLVVAAVSGSAQVGYAERSGIDKAKIMQLPDNPTAVAAIRAGRADAYAISAPRGARARGRTAGAGHDGHPSLRHRRRRAGDRPRRLRLPQGGRRVRGRIRQAPDGLHRHAGACRDHGTARHERRRAAQDRNGRALRRMTTDGAMHEAREPRTRPPPGRMPTAGTFHGA